MSSAVTLHQPAADELHLRHVENRKLARRIAWPAGGRLAANRQQFVHRGIHTADAMMAGRLGAESLAAVAVGGSVWFFGFAFAMGTLMAISPIAARHYGAGNPELIGRYSRQGIYLAIFIGLGGPVCRQPPGRARACSGRHRP